MTLQPFHQPDERHAQSSSSRDLAQRGDAVLPPDPGTSQSAETATLGSADDCVLLAHSATHTAGVHIRTDSDRPAYLRSIERLVNLAIALPAFLLALPLMILIAIAIKLTSRGPVLYSQPRIGINRRGVCLPLRRRGDERRNLWARFLALHDDQRGQDLGGDVFNIYKFRTMCDDAERDTGVVWAVRNDPRTTRLGCFLRKYRLDELPQIVNVLKGDMNIVGPRPERPSIFVRLREAIEEYPRRQEAKPGITGWAQIHLFYDSCIDDVREKVRYDLEYLKRKSLRKDLAIMLRTLPAVLFRRKGW